MMRMKKNVILNVYNLGLAQIYFYSMHGKIILHLMQQYKFNASSMQWLTNMRKHGPFPRVVSGKGQGSERLEYKWE